MKNYNEWKNEYEHRGQFEKLIVDELTYIKGRLETGSGVTEFPPQVLFKALGDLRKIVNDLDKGRDGGDHVQRPWGNT